MMKLKFSLVVIVALCFHSFVFAQDNYKVTGTVVTANDNIPFPGVNVLVVGTSNGATTDFDGNYSITVKKGDVLQFSYVGFVTQTVIVDNQQTINVGLVEDASKLDEIVVIGYGTQSREKITGAIGKVKNEDLDQIAVGTANEALVGQVAGLNVQATESEAGSESTITIRGVGSIAGRNGPLLVVDGVVLESSFLSSIDVNDIASVEVLKDASSAAIYGSRAVGGVVIITTKEGKEGKTQFTYNTFTGFKEAIKSEDYDLNVADHHARELASTGELSLRSQYRELLGVDESWQDRVFDGGKIESHFLSARGGSKRTKFNTSLSYLHDEGVLVTDDYKKYNFKFKVDTEVNDNFKFGANLSPSVTNRRRFDGSVHDILRQQPWLPTYHDANSIQFVDFNTFPDVQIGDYAQERHFDNFDLFGDGSELVDLSSTSNTNPLAKVQERHSTEENFRIYGKFYGQYKLAEGLDFRLSFGGDYQDRRQRRYEGVLASRNGASDASLEISSRNRTHILTEALLTYDKSFGSHDINVVLGTSAETFDTTYESATGIGFTNDLLQTLSAAPIISAKESYEIEERLLSYFGRVNWSFENKYLASVSLRADGSSVFGANNKYGFFPAASVGWNIAKEDFLLDSDFLSTLKLRGSYGFTGNKDLDVNNIIIESYPSLQLYGSETAVNGTAINNGFAPINIANPDLKWERVREVNAAIDFGFYNNRISGALDVYNKKSDQLLLNVPISTITGFRDALVNRGAVENRGVELELRTINITNQDFKWTTTLLGSTNKNELVDFGGASGLISNVDDKRAAEWINFQGQPISSFYGFVVDREIPEEFIVDPYRLVGAQAQDVYVKDLNGDGVIDDDDKTIIGDPYPELIWSIANDFRYKNIDFSFTFQGSYGGQVRNMTDQYIFNHFNSSQDFNQNTTPDQGFIREKIFTDAIIQDASYVALRTVSLGYTLDTSIVEKLGVRKTRVYATAQNLFFATADGYTGWNPEAIRDEGVLNEGYQRGGSPVARTISLGLNVEF